MNRLITLEFRKGRLGRRGAASMVKMKINELPRLTYRYVKTNDTSVEIKRLVVVNLSFLI